jgi:sulfhydrogenase subunit beta (sulfur reductase)
MKKLISKKAFPGWVKSLASYRIYAPAKRGADLWEFELVEDPVSIDLSFPPASQSPKTIIFPQREVMLRFKTGDSGLEMEEVLPDASLSVIFGVRPCDARGLALLDKVFGGDFEDPYYWARRNAAVLVGSACTKPPSPNCFCLSVGGSPFSTDGLDAMITDLGDRFLVESLTPKGEQLLGAGSRLEDAPAGDIAGAANLKASAEKEIERGIENLAGVPARLKQMFESPFWEEEAQSCIRCGICTYTCPTCHCFDMNDEVASSAPLEGERVRTWDTCQFPDFTMHSSGHNPRPDRASRLRQRLLHKFQYFPERYGSFLCTGCGRCVSRCPVGIDIIEVLDKVSRHGR